MEKLISFLEDQKGTNIIVEGKRDKNVLSKLGFKKIFVLNKSRGFYNLSEKLKDKEVLILTDFDPEGEKIAKRLSKILVRMNSTVKRNPRNKLRKLFLMNKINTIEGLKNCWM